MEEITGLTVGIVSWDGMHDAAAAIAEAIPAGAENLVVIYSNAAGVAETGAGTWVETPQAHYFGRKFRALLRAVPPGHALLLIQADATSADWGRLVTRYKEVCASRPDVGVWSPVIDNSAFPNGLVTSGPQLGGLIEVNQTDAIVLGLHPKVLDRLGRLEFEQNNLGWGIDWAAIGFCKAQGLPVVRDLTESIHHPRSRGYDSTQATEQMNEFLKQLSADEARAVAQAEKAIAAKVMERDRLSHTNISSLKDTRPMEDSAFNPKTHLLEKVSFLMVQSGRVLITPRDKRQDFAILLDDMIHNAAARSDKAVLPMTLGFRMALDGEISRKLVSGDQWSCPGQSTLQLLVAPNSDAIRMELTDPIELDSAIGDVQLCMGAAVHRANVDLMIKWQDSLDPDLGKETWIKLDTKFSGNAELGDYQKIRVRIPETGGTRIVQVFMCFWRRRFDTEQPCVMLCTRPYLVNTSEADASSIVMTSDHLEPQTVPNLEIPITPSTGDVRLVVDGQEFLLIAQENHGARIVKAGAVLEARADEYSQHSLHVNGRATRLLWVGPEPQPINLTPEIMRDPGTSIELRDPTGNVIHARWKPAPEDIPGPKVARHPDAWLIDSLFEKDFYLAGFTPEDRPADPASHYLQEGWQQGRDPAPWFSTWHYLSMHRDVAAAGMNPFTHYCAAGHAEGRALPKLGKQTGNVYDAHTLAVAPGPDFEEFDPTIGVGRRKRAKVLAYYLPQFHAVDVNNKNWGDGFTEWRNLPRALPRFMGHIQPRIPRDLGCYDLSEGDAMRRQIEMAKAAGLFGFCFYHYWFDGKRVLETPMERLLADPSLDFPFCLMWANENWTRTWDGSAQQIILGQNYREEDDVPFIDDLARHMKDRRYIRIGSRPLFFIYRPGEIPEAREKIKAWRALMRTRHGLDPLILMAQGFGDLDPRKYDLDGAIEFPPHKICQDLPPLNGKIDLLDPDYAGHIISYDDMTERSTGETRTEFPLIRTVTPTWDNEARRPGRGMIIHGSTPDKFADWCESMLSYAQANPVHGEPIMCVNAWNEWAEGAVLEPDVHYGAAYLNALSRAVHNASETSANHKVNVVIVGHDAHINGAQTLALNLGKTLVSRFGVSVCYVLGDDGPLLPRYREIGHVEVCKPGARDSAAIFEDLAADGYTLAITNTTPSGRFLPDLKAAGFTVVSLIHELPNLLKSYNLQEPAKKIAAMSDHVVFPAEVVRDGFISFTGGVEHVAEVFPQGLYNTSVLEIAQGDNGLRAELGLAPETKIVLGVGYADLRKGIDRFVSAGLSLCANYDDIAFLWVGAPAGETINWFQPEIDASGFGDRVRILGHRDDIARFFAASNAFYLASREDPFPSVVLEALASGLPVIGHEGCGGCDTLIRKHGVLLQSSDPGAVTDSILTMLNQRSRRAAKARQAEIAEKYNFAAYAYGLVQRLLPNTPTVSAVVPNYKYEAYIGARLRTVFEQNYPLREVVVLDDASPDNSLAEIKRTASAAGRVIDLHVNLKNSGSPFPQWRKGVELAQGEYVWIGEADDLADPTFVSRLIEQMQLAGSVLGFTDSNQIDENSERLGDSYKPYINQIEPGAFDKPFDMDGPEFLARFLAIKNVILNVSGVIFHRETLLDAFDAVGDELYTYSVAGDWRLYAEICARAGSRVSYLPDALNTHRRHRISVTHALKVDKHLSEIDTMHNLIASRVSLSPSTIEMQKINYEECRKHLEGN